MRFRNIWVRRLTERPEPPAGYVPNAIALTPSQLQGTVGTYYAARAAGAASPAGGAPNAAAAMPLLTVTARGNELYVAFGGGGAARSERAIPTALDRLWMTGRAAELVLTRNSSGVVTAISEAGSTLAPAQRRDTPP